MRRATRGFTVVELMVVVLIVSVVAGLAIPRFGNSTEQGYLATMKGDLRNLAVAQEAYCYDNSTYYNGPLPSVLLTHDPSKGVSLTLQNVSVGGWATTATHVATDQVCAMFVGNAPPAAPATVIGEAVCD